MKGERVILITGANRGLGRLIADQLAVPGNVLVLACRDAQRGRAVAAELRKKCSGCIPVTLDLGAPASITRVARSIHRRFGVLHALINNAGVFLHPEDLELSSLTWTGLANMIGANLTGPFWLLQQLLPSLRAARGACVVNVTSDMADASTFQGDYTAYRVSKAGLNALTANAAAALKKDSILVNAVDPGWIPTDMGGSDAPDDPLLAAAVGAWAAQLPAKGPSGRIFRCEEAAAGRGSPTPLTLTPPLKQEASRRFAQIFFGDSTKV